MESSLGSCVLLNDRLLLALPNVALVCLSCSFLYYRCETTSQRLSMVVRSAVCFRNREETRIRPEHGLIPQGELIIIGREIIRSIAGL